MLIDDTEVDNFISKKVMAASAFSSEIMEFYSAQKALNFLLENKENKDRLPQIIFLDIHMPAMDGFDFMEKFKELPSEIHQYCKVVMLSSSLDPEDVRRIKESNHIVRFMTKPISKDQLQSLNLEMNATLS